MIEGICVTVYMILIILAAVDAIFIEIPRIEKRRRELWEEHDRIMRKIIDG